MACLNFKRVSWIEKCPKIEHIISANYYVTIFRLFSIFNIFCPFKYASFLHVWCHWIQYFLWTKAYWKQAWKFSSITSLSQVSQLWSMITRQRIVQGWGEKPPPPSFVRSINPNFIQKFIRLKWTSLDLIQFSLFWSN